MKLFIFKRLANPERFEGEYHEGGWPLIFAIHPTKENITKEEWAQIVDQVRERFSAEFDRFVALGKQIQKDGFLLGGTEEGRRIKELKIHTNPLTVLEEILIAKGFQIMETQKLSFLTPLTDYDKKRKAEREAFNERIKRTI